MTGGKVSRYFFIDVKLLFGLDEVSYTILSLVVSAVCRNTALCGK